MAVVVALVWRLAVLAYTLAGQIGQADAQHREEASQGGLPVAAVSAYRLVNSEAVEVVWRIRSVQFFTDEACASPLSAVPNATGESFGTLASDMTEAVYVFALRSPRGWESVGPCAPGACHVGFAWWNETPDVRCLLLQQGETGLHADAVTLQRHNGGASAWLDVATWGPLEGGKVKLSLACPDPPSVPHGRVKDCRSDGARSGQCTVECDEGFGTVEPRLKCIHGAWYSPQCLALGSLVRVVAHAPELIKPYWVVLDAVLYSKEDCTDVLRMEGQAISSGEYVIKYANYHPNNVWDSDPSSSWASSEPCAPGSCYFGFRFQEPVPAGRIRCVRVEHPVGARFQATAVSVEVLGRRGWEKLPDVAVRLLPERHEEL